MLSRFRAIGGLGFRVLEEFKEFRGWGFIGLGVRFGTVGSHRQSRDGHKSMEGGMVSQEIQRVGMRN